MLDGGLDVMGALIVVGGGVRSGKSAFALSRGRALGSHRVFVATAEAFDEEMRDRIARHIEQRGDTFRTVEAPVRLADAVDAAGDADVVVVDCLTIWMANLLLRGESEGRILREVDALVLGAARSRAALVVVTNEVGMGIVPESAVGRAFRDVSGRAHQRLATAADEIYFAAMGCILRLRPGPVALAEGAP